MQSLPGGSANTIRRFVDPGQYQSAIRGGDSLYSVLERGLFRAELTSIALGRLTLQRGREELPRVAASGIPPNKVGLLGWFGNGLLPVVRGVQMRRGEFLCLGPGMQSHHRTFGPNDFVSLMLHPDDLTRFAIDATGRDVTVAAGAVIRPPDDLGAWLLSAIDAATDATRKTPDIFASPLATDALEQALLRPMITCLMHGDERMETVPRRRRVDIAKRFEAAVEASFDNPVLMPELCRIIGVPERTLRSVCQEQFALSPHRFLALRRLHMTRETLLRSDYRSVTVTQIATNYGYWELGRFAVIYKSLFGESPSATLRRAPDPSSRR